MSQLQLRQGDLAGALPNLQYAAQQMPDNDHVLAKLAATQLALGDKKAAEDTAKRVLTINPLNEDAHAVYQLARQKVDGELPPGLAQRVAIMTGGGSPSGERLGSADRIPFEGMLPRSFRGGSALIDSIVSALGRGNNREAARLADDAIKRDGRDAQALNLRAIARGRLGDSAGAFADADQALRLSGDNVAALMTKAWALNRLHRFGEALEVARRILGMDSGNARAYQLLANALAGLGDRKGMLAALRRAAQLDPSLEGLYERASRLPQSEDALLLFEDDRRGSPPPPAQSTPGRGVPWWMLLGIPLAAVLARRGLRTAEPSRVPPAAPTPLSLAVPSSPTPARAAPAAEPKGLLGDGYKVVKELGSGSLGVVYEATELPSGRKVAVKRIREEIHLKEKDLDQALEAARRVAGLKHPNVAEIYSVFLEKDRIHLVMEFAKGPPLAQVLEERGALPSQAAYSLAAEAALAIDFAHQKNILHGDLRSSNVFVVGEGLVKVTDFQLGIQVRKAAARLAWKEALGNPAYMAPEQELGTTFKESDVYALAVLVYEMLTGSLPFEGPNFLAQKRERSCPKPSLASPGLPLALDAVLFNALQPEPQHRFHSAADFCSALASSLGIPAA